VSISRTADVNDVLAELEAHVEQALADAPQPVPLDALRPVLERLGRPREWITGEDMTWWRRTVLRLRTGPEDWRLAYAALAANVTGLILFPYMCTAFVFLMAGFVLSRACLADRSAELPEGQKWLVYPSPIAVYLLLAITVVVILPILAGAGGFDQSYRSLRHASWEYARGDSDVPPPSAGYYPAVFKFVGLHPETTGSIDARAGIFGVWVGVVSAGLWWIILALMLRSRRVVKAAQAMFHPFMPRSLGRWPKLLLTLGIILVSISLAVICVTA